MAAEITVYGLKNCDSCRNTLRLCTELGIPAKLIDVRDHPPEHATLLTWCQQFGRTALLNKRSTTWRKLTAAQQQVDDDAAAVQLLMEYPTLMKRPLIVRDAQRLLGFDRQLIATTFQ